MGKPRAPSNWREERRLRAYALKKQGWTQRAIAAALGVTEGAVSQWMHRAREGGEAGLRHRPPPGRPRRLTPEQLAGLPDLLLAGAEFFGFRGDLWTQRRIADVVRREFGVSYDPSQIGRLLKLCGWSVQKPVRRAIQRDEAAIERWRREKWPEIQKGQERTDRQSSS